MRVSFLITTTLSMHLGLLAFTQNLSLSVKREPLGNVLILIEKKSSYRFLYNDNPVFEQKKISLRLREASLNEVMKRLLEGTGLIYSVNNNNLVILSASSGNENTSGNVNNDSAGEKTFIPITGKVTDSAGNGLADVSIIVRGTKKGASTNSSGFFIIDADPGDVLEFSMVGYRVVTVTVGNSAKINITLQVLQAALTDVVITAYGQKQRKEAIVGSVTSISAKELKIPSSNLTTAFAGRIAGLIAYQRTGEPGMDNASFFIRGVTTFGQGSGNPLILIDNIELTVTDLARLQPDDIESFSILKDASATALYGARGANGVIFVTTKQGKEGKAKFNIRVENSISAPTRNLKIADPVTHMQLYTEAQLTRDPLAKLLYSQNKIDHTIAKDNRYVYPATNWFDLMFKKQTSVQRANISLSGGGKIATYYIAGSYSLDHGILNNNGRNNFNTNVKLSSYQLRTNVNIKVTPTTDLAFKMFGIFDDYRGPVDGGSNLYLKALRSSPALFAPFYKADSANIAAQHILFGNYRTGDAFYINPYAEMVRGYKDYSRSRMLAQFELSQNLAAITKGLSFRSLFSTNRYAYFDVQRAYGPYYYNIGTYDKQADQYTLTWLNETQGPARYEDIRSMGGFVDQNTSLYGQATLDYTRLFKAKHNIGATLVYTIQHYLSSANFDVQSSLPHRNVGLSGRASYAYDNRYFAELNFGYNGSERFYKDQQFGFFPTIGLAWVVSNENFWKPGFINKLKLRGSYGLVGNDNIGNGIFDRFFYLSSVNLDDGSRGARFGYDNGYGRTGVSISRYPNKDITWEKSYQTNLAVELGLLNKINIVAEVYQQHRKNILMSRASIPSTMGLSSTTRANVGEAKSMGVDLSLDYTENFNKRLWITVRGSFTYARGEFLKYEEPDFKDKYLSHVGQSINQTWGFIAERLFIDEKDVQSAPRQNFGFYQAGDIKYRDVNGDGQITDLDRVPIGYPTIPEITYGFGVSAGYRQFDFSMFMQGLARESFWINPYQTAPFINYDDPIPINKGLVGENALLQAYANSHWSEEKRDIYAIWPRLSVTPVENNNQASTWFMRDGSFLRVKSAELGYSLPQQLLNRYKISNFRIYFSGTNLFTFSAFRLWDPEMGGNGLAYPIQKVYNLGINLNF